MTVRESESSLTPTATSPILVLTGVTAAPQAFTLTATCLILRSERGSRGETPAQTEICLLIPLTKVSRRITYPDYSVHAASINDQVVGLDEQDFQIWEGNYHSDTFSRHRRFDKTAYALGAFFAARLR